MPLLRMAKPPVPAVPNAMQRLSNSGMPPSSRKPMHSTVSSMYRPYRISAVWRRCGVSLPTLGPGLSARIRYMPEPALLRASGTTASRNTRMPMPPSQWLKLRQ